MWSDNESLADYIDYSHLVKAVTGIVDNNDLLPCSIGIYGDWGSGKSSLMKMVESKYENRKDILLIKFNGWRFEGYEDAKTVLMGRIVDEIIAKRTLKDKALKYAAKLLKSIDILKTAGSAVKYGLGYLTMGAAGVMGTAAIDVMSKAGEIDYEEYIKKKQEKKEEDPDETIRSNVEEFHKNFEELIKETNIEKILVFIDDLDRCSPDTIISTLEAIKLFLFTKSTAFIIGADERLIKYAVRRRFPEVPGENMEVGRDYLEKLIQYPIRIPPLNSLELTTYINLLFSKLYCGSDADFESIRNNIIQAKQTKGFDFVLNQSNLHDFFKDTGDDFADAIALCAQIVPVLSIGLNGNPRQVKRFLNTMLIRINMATAKNIILKRRHLAKLMLLEYFKPETFTAFHDIQASNQGTLPILAELERTLQLKDEKATTPSLTAEQKTLSEDTWIMEWINSDPKLSNENLQPYFYFSRDKLTITAVNLQRMTPLAQEIIQKLLSDSKAVQAIAHKNLQNLSSSDAASIFEALTQKVRQQENLIDNPAFKALFEISREKPELKSQIISFLSHFPESKLPISAAPLTEGLLKDSHALALEQLLKKWSSSTSNKTLAKTINKKLKA